MPCEAPPVVRIVPVSSFVAVEPSEALMPTASPPFVTMEPEFVASESAEATMPWEPMPFVTIVPLFAAKEFVCASMP